MTHILVPCNHCDARTQARILGEREFGRGDHWEPYRYQFVECTHCQNVLVAFSEWELDDQDGHWGRATRSWPDPEDDFNSKFPSSVEKSLKEAKRCLSTRSYMAAAVMCGRAVEALCKDKVGARTLGSGLKKLKDSQIIDSKLFEWGEALRKERNIGAHANDEEITPQNARDVFDFAVALSEYVYVLDEKYKAYQARKEA